jgi:hypothetical protein
MTEADWINGTDPKIMLASLKTSSKVSDRKSQMAAARVHRLDGTAAKWVTAAWTATAAGIVLETTRHMAACLPKQDYQPARWDDESREQCNLLREIIGNPFHLLPPLPASMLQWNLGLVRRLAEEAYEKRQLPSGHLDNARLAVLADALEEAGMADRDILGHLRQPEAIHTRGCWTVDLLLGRL